MPKIKWLWVICLVAAVFYTRFVGLTWGMPYPFHPDERNIAIAVSHLAPSNLFKPDFFAYGQLTIYASYFLSVLQNVLLRKAVFTVSAEQATLWLRIISALASVVTVYVGLKIASLFVKKESDLFANYYLLITTLFLAFSPVLIQFAHFGTTESFLMFLYTLLVYVCLLLIHAPEENRVKYFLASAIVVGLAAAAKISSLSFALLPIAAFLLTDHPRKILKNILWIFLFGEIVLISTFAFSPYTFIASREFISSLRYESAVATGADQVFYTRIFFLTKPILFQFINIFPYALGWPIFILFLIGFFTLPWKKNYNVLRIAFLLFFLPQAFLFAKWTRFLAPIFPLMVIVAGLLVSQMYNLLKSHLLARLAAVLIILGSIIPGLAYLSIYQHPDVRFQASEWIYKNIPQDSYILSETANVVDIPIPTPNTKSQSSSYRYISFNFYDLDTEPRLQDELAEHLQKADYIFVLSRRIFANHTCFTNDQMSVISDKKKCEALKKKYPLLNVYYSNLFSGRLGFKKVAEFTSYPRLFNWDFPDEQSEETWTVFDHPVVRIYKRS